MIIEEADDSMRLTAPSILTGGNVNVRLNRTFEPAWLIEGDELRHGNDTSAFFAGVIHHDVTPEAGYPTIAVFTKPATGGNRASA